MQTRHHWFELYFIAKSVGRGGFGSAPTVAEIGTKSSVLKP
jgi:hypothetical protein